MLSDPNTNLPPAFRTALHAHWKIFLAEGILLAALGVGAILLPPFAGVAATILLGWLLLVAGVVGLTSSFGARAAPGFSWSVVSAVVALVAGLALVWNPLAGLVTLTFVLTAYFVADGVVVIALALSHRTQLSGKWEWMLVNGLIDLALAGLILSGMPGSVAWVLGLLVGIDLLVGGISLIAMATEARK